METNDKPKTIKEPIDWDGLRRIKAEIDRMTSIENTLRSCSEEGEICEQIIEPNREHGYDHFGDIAMTMSLTYNRLELIDTYQNETCPETFSKLVVDDIEDIAKLVDCFKIDISDTDNLLDNLFQALTDYASTKGLHCSADFMSLFDELAIEYDE